MVTTANKSSAICRVAARAGVWENQRRARQVERTQRFTMRNQGGERCPMEPVDVSHDKGLEAPDYVPIIHLLALTVGEC